MANKKLFIGIAAAAAALAAVGIVLSRQRSSQRRSDGQLDEAKQHFKSKLNELQRKAQKQYKNSPDEAKDTIANATARATKS